MLLLRTDSLPDSPEWLYELKLDGYRAIAFKRDGTLYLRSRNDNDFNVRYPAVAKALTKLPENTVIDGEVVAFSSRRAYRRPRVGYRFFQLALQGPDPRLVMLLCDSH